MAASIKQMKVRSQGHRRALHKIADGKPLLGAGASFSEARGVSKMVRTLRRWGCVETVYGRDENYKMTASHVITETGRRLLEDC